MSRLRHAVSYVLRAAVLRMPLPYLRYEIVQNKGHDAAYAAAAGHGGHDMPQRARGARPL